MIEWLVSMMKEKGLRDTLTCSKNLKISFRTVFETKYAAFYDSAGKSISSFWRFRWICPFIPVNICVFGCEVHYKHVVLEKLDIRDEHNLNKWNFSTRRVHKGQERSTFLSVTVRMGAYWASFYLWVEQKYVGNILWLQDLHKSNLLRPEILNVMHTFNANETENFILKGRPP